MLLRYLRNCFNNKLPFTPSFEKEFDFLAETIISKTTGKRIYYLANVGNWGDALIRHGALKFFKHYGIKHKELKLTAITDDLGVSIDSSVGKTGILLYGGGGAWCNLFDHSVGVLNLVRQSFLEILVLPSSYEKEYAIPNTTFFSRDNFESRENMPGSTFCHDMAFCLTPSRIPCSKERGNFFRIDEESAGKIDIPSGNSDISHQGNHLSSIEDFFVQVAQFSVVHTDRLHVAIAACLLGRELHLYPGSYFKNKAVFLSSIEPKFKNVHFHEM